MRFPTLFFIKIFDFLRFDFNFQDKITREKVCEIEKIVNFHICENLPSDIMEMKFKDASDRGFTAIFSEKYGEIVRAVSFGEFSKELCAGTHVQNTKEIGAFKILSENSSGAGIRRIEAITSVEILNYIEKIEASLFRVCDVFKVKQHDEIETKAKDLVVKFKDNKEQLSKIKLKLCENQFCDVFDNFKQNIGKLEVVVFDEQDLDKKELRVFADCLKKKLSFVVALIFIKYDLKFNIAVICGEEAVKIGAFANEIVQKLVKIVDGHGGGKKDFAMAGIPDFSKKDEMTNLFYEISKEVDG